MSTSRFQHRVRNTARASIHPQSPSVLSSADLRAQHGDPAQWDARDIQAYLDLDGELGGVPTGDEAA